MPCNALARINATVAKQTLIAELFQSPETTSQALNRLLLQIEGVTEVHVQVANTRLTVTCTRDGTPYRASVRQTTGTLRLTGGDAAFLERLRTVLEELGGAFLQDRIARALKTTFGTRAAEIASPGRARLLTVHL